MPYSAYNKEHEGEDFYVTFVPEPPVGNVLRVAPTMCFLGLIPAGQEISRQYALNNRYDVVSDVVNEVVSDVVSDITTYCTYERICAGFALRANFSLVG